MAKKIGKNSRAARQAAYELALEPESKSLSELPRVENTNLSNILIRVSAKNEALLDAKIGKKKQTKGKSKATKKLLEQRINDSITSIDKDRLERALHITNKLDGKISKSISRAKYVQTTRKQGWDSINNAVRRELNPVAAEKKLDLENEDKMQDSEIAAEIKDDMNVETYGDAEGWDEERNEKKVADQLQNKNMFDLLPLMEDE
ncbi:hypothetical protein TPHA_0H03090 [Tetrapisispora phaffii CBS 4417]|uniref:Uncharacterized protein n=1 Tax=Tetrapisispora phaffii (strain ATCC 24235 / CBS 4417 / NBRC 1672 / NRRL Y-8282 / UCD 70-5) TaxID=1071381 RepID=G8BWR1_TETPH|nr:hypothetical protein TPHA_0H03090 [Tetrapisispora phaffii CBS 4417]CCE64512.1 hypothetical protein TPHA_0H03090 [Tetrapisispora phaffii CBS 4417]